jgi:hypothetical protein
MTELDHQITRLRLGATPKLHFLYTEGGRGLPIYVLGQAELTLERLNKKEGIAPYSAKGCSGRIVLDDKAYELWMNDYKRSGSPVVSRNGRDYIQIAER